MQVTRWGNSLAIRLAAAFEALSLKEVTISKSVFPAIAPSSLAATKAAWRRWRVSADCAAPSLRAGASIARKRMSGANAENLPEYQHRPLRLH